MRRRAHRKSCLAQSLERAFGTLGRRDACAPGRGAPVLLAPRAHRLSSVVGRSSFENDLCDSVFGGVREGDVGVGRTGAGEDFVGEVVQQQCGCAAGLRDDLHVLPCEAAAPAGAERLECRFFRGEARGIMLRGDHAAPLAVVAFGKREDALRETRRAPQHAAHATDFDDVDADGNDHDNCC